MTFLYPQMFLYLLLPVIILMLLMLMRKSKTLTLFSDEVLAKLQVAGQSSLNKTSRLLMLFTVLFLMIIAFAKPVIDNGEKEIEQKGREVIIALDISRSMDAVDLYPNRLAVSISKISSLLEKIRGDKVAVVAFAGSSYIISPMTADTGMAKYLLDTLDIKRFNDRSSNIDSLFNAVKDMGELKDKTVIVFSDGDEGNLDYLIARAKEHHTKIYAIGLGESKGEAIPDGKGGFVKDSSGKIVISSKNPEFSKLALATGGAYIDYTLGDDDIDAIYSALKRGSKDETFEAEKIHDYTELFYYPLIVAFLFLLISFHSMPKKIVSALLLSMFVMNPKMSYAVSFDVLTMQEADKLYRSGSYDKAIATYQKVEGLDTQFDAVRHFNIGNAYASSGALDKAIESYEASLKIEENDDTKHNLELVKAEQKKQEEEKQEEQKENDENQEQNDENQKNQDSKQQDSDKQKEQNQQKDSKQQSEKDKESQDSSEQKDSAEQKKSEEEAQNEKAAQDDVKQKEEEQKAKEQQAKKEQKNSDEDAPKQKRGLEVKDPSAMSDTEEKMWLRKSQKNANPMQLKKIEDENEGERQHVKAW
jgi:Ca-activated chloride channel family protein